MPTAPFAHFVVCSPNLTLKIPLHPLFESAPVMYRILKKLQDYSPNSFPYKIISAWGNNQSFCYTSEVQFRFTTNTRHNHSSETIGLSFNQVISLVRRRKFAIIMLLLTALAILLIVPGLLGADKTKGPKVTDKVSVKHV